MITGKYNDMMTIDSGATIMCSGSEADVPEGDLCKVKIRVASGDIKNVDRVGPSNQIVKERQSGLLERWRRCPSRR